MDFGHVPPEMLGKIDLALPPDDPRTWTELGKHKLIKSGPDQAPLRIGIGCPIWTPKEWVGTIYPPGTDSKDFLYHYSRQFTSIELNTTHYRTPDKETIKRWRETTPDDFRFNPKLLQEISHRKPIWAHEALTREFVENVMELGERLGACFMQLPPTFAPGDLPDLRKFLSTLPKDFPIAVEVRHPSFFVDHRLAPPLYDVLVQAGAHVVITDVAGRRDVLHTSLTSPTALVRFIGNNGHPTDETRIEEWVARIHTWLNLGLRHLEFFVHQMDNKDAPTLIAKLIDRLNETCNLQLPKWKAVEEKKEQLSFF